jgi:HEAT repeat protein
VTLVRALERVGAAYPSAVLPAVDSLLAHAESTGAGPRFARHRETEERAWRATGEGEPRRGATRRSRAAERGDPSEARPAALAAVGRVAAVHPGAVESAVPRLTALFDDDAADVRAAAARVLADVADHRPDAVAPAAERVVPLVDDEDETVRRAATAVLAGLARTAPERVQAAGAAEPLVGALSAEFTCTRSNAAWLLGRIGADEARDALADRRRDDPVTEVREAAAWALDRLEEA